VKVKILQSAFDDLADGAEFYDRCEPGVGSYFVDSLLADIDSLRSTPASTASSVDIIGLCRNDSPSPSTTKSKTEAR